MLISSVWMILVWVIPILLIVALLKYLFAKSRDTGSRAVEPEQKTPLDILKEAYARGEIDRDTYLLKRDDLLEK